MNAIDLPDIPAPDAACARAMQRTLDHKTKPRGSLGRLEDLAVKLATLWATDRLSIRDKAVVVMGGDHGVASRGVSAYPAEVTQQMLRNIAEGGAAISVLARAAGARLVVVDMGVAVPVQHDRVRAIRIGSGTGDLTVAPAMTGAQARQAMRAGLDLAGELAADGIQLVALGEMGIGNTTAASAITARLTASPVAAVTGRGTGVDDAGLDRKLRVIELALRRCADSDPMSVLANFGGFEIAGLVGLALGAAARRMPVVIDGFITGAAALVAARLRPDVLPYLVASHQSVESGHRVQLQALGLQPLLDLELRLGEGTGAALALPLVDAAVHIAAEMATFAEAGVSSEQGERQVPADP